MKPTFRKAFVWTLLAAPLLAAPLALAACRPALAAGYGDSGGFSIVDKLVDWIGWSDFTGDKRDLFAFGLGVYAVCFGLLTDMAVKEKAFGRVMNGVVGVIGVCLVLFLCGPRLHLLNDLPENYRFNFALLASGVGSAVFLLVCAVAMGVLQAAPGAGAGPHHPSGTSETGGDGGRPVAARRRGLAEKLKSRTLLE